tara:strand:+ start:809 stop:1318 length:510 start_codon:yes stop_codon:yes gene_type:complete
MMRAQDILKLGAGSRKKAGELAKNFIISDANKGKFQNGKSGIRYGPYKTKSYTYADYKKNNMRTFVIDAGRKLKGFEAVKSDTQTNFVNANLTGETLDRITSKAKTGNTLFELNYERGEVVMGLKAKKKADLYDLSDENKTRVVNILMKEVARKADKYMAEDVKINIGK